MLAALALTLLLQAPNGLTAAEKRAGWELLFDGVSTKGWHNFKAEGVKPGWQVKDGALCIVDPGQAGDIVSDAKFDWFELRVEVNIGKGQNSGIMYHVNDAGDSTYKTGPEIQIYDHALEPGHRITGFLYGLYESKVDAAKPVGEWNEIVILITPKKCTTAVNGVQYYEYVLDSDDFKARVKSSGMDKYPDFAKVHNGSIALQGDHGKVSFRNIKIRRIKG